MRPSLPSGRRAATFVTTLLTVALLGLGSSSPVWGAPVPLPGDEPSGVRTADAQAARGLVYDSLFPALPGSPCEGVAFEIHEADGGVSCTHGPDPAPPGIDVRAPRSLAAFQADAQALGPSAVPCIGNGTSGRRVQVIYAVSSDKVDRYDAIAPLIRV
jgi:hypothetical protein